MANYKDANQNEWTVEITVKTLKDVQKNIKDADGKPLDLMATVTGNLVVRLMTAPALLSDILWIVCKTQAENKGLNQEQFAAAQRGDALDAGLDALVEALAGFFPKQLRVALTQLYKKTKTMQAQAVQTAISALDQNLNQQKSDGESGD